MDSNTNQLSLAAVEPGAPVDLYCFFILRICYEFYSKIGSATNSDFDFKVSALISFLPDREAREQIWASYVEERGEGTGNVRSASVHAVGNCISYLAQVMDLTKVSWAGFL
jgi:hypothetical protein